MDVVSFFERAERLIFDVNPPLTGEGLDAYRVLWKAGYDGALDRLLAERVGKSWRRAQYRAAVSEVLKGEILRVGIRLRVSLDGLLDEGTMSVPPIT